MPLAWIPPDAASSIDGIATSLSPSDSRDRLHVCRTQLRQIDGAASRPRPPAPVFRRRPRTRQTSQAARQPAIRSGRPLAVGEPIAAARRPVRLRPAAWPDSDQVVHRHGDGVPARCRVGNFCQSRGTRRQQPDLGARHSYNGGQIERQHQPRRSRFAARSAISRRRRAAGSCAAVARVRATGCASSSTGST